MDLAICFSKSTLSGLLARVGTYLLSLDLRIPSDVVLLDVLRLIAFNLSSVLLLSSAAATVGIVDRLEPLG